MIHACVMMVRNNLRPVLMSLLCLIGILILQGSPLHYTWLVTLTCCVLMWLYPCQCDPQRPYLAHNIFRVAMTVLVVVSLIPTTALFFMDPCNHYVRHTPYTGWPWS